MEHHEKRTPGAEQHTGGTGEDRMGHRVIIGDSIAQDASGADQKDLLEFLRGWSPDGPWWPTAIPREGGKTETRTFTDLGALAKWASGPAGDKNLYFHVNDLSPGAVKKASKEEVTRIRGLHVDVDPRAPEAGWPKTPTLEQLVELAAHHEAERARIRAMFDDWEKDGKKLPFPRPTVIIDSGGGYQGFWLFAEGEAVAPDVAEALNMMISAAMGGDNTHDVTRLMRLPGAVNLANQKKRDRGRGDAPTRLVAADWARQFRAADFPTPPEKSKEVKAGVERVNLSKDLPRVESLDNLPVSPEWRAVIVNGNDPDRPDRWPSRSETLWAVLCEMVRAGVADDTMAALILDPDYGISAHVLEQPRPHQYAARQIQRARDKAVDPWLLRLNDRHTVLGNQGGKCRILEFVRRPTGIRGQTRAVVSLQSFEDFRNRYMNKWVVVGQDKDGKDVQMPVGKWWLQNEHRREFHSLVFSPRDGEVVEAESGDPDERQLNLWRGFAVKPAPGDWSLMRKHIREVLADGDEASDSYILRWMAWTVQNPDQPAEVALVFRGEMGTGKGVFGRMMARLFGQHGLHTGGTELISGRFNQHLADCCLLFADEILWDGDKKAEARMKVYLTEETIVIEGKGVDAAAWPNMLHVIMSSNSEWVVPAGRHERRYAVFDVSSAQRQRREYFKPLFAQMDAGGLAAMLHDMLTMDLGDWHPRQDRPETAALADQKSRGLGPVEGTVLDWFREGALPPDLVTGDRRGSDERPFIYTSEVADFIAARTRDRVTMNMVAEVLKRIGAVKSRKDRPSGYLMPTLAEAREAWNAHPDLPNQDWDGEEHWPGGAF